MAYTVVATELSRNGAKPRFSFHEGDTISEAEAKRLGLSLDFLLASGALVEVKSKPKPKAAPKPAPTEGDG